jgi:hypothetical protein
VRNLTVYRVAALALVAGLLGACTAANAGESDLAAENLPSADAFKAGTCRSAAGDVLGLATLARSIHGAGTVSAGSRRELRAHQYRLARLRNGAEPEMQKAITDLVTSIGYVRIRFNGQSYDPKIVKQMDDTRRGFQKLCV